MKKCIVFLLVLTFIFSFTGCTSEKPIGETSSDLSMEHNAYYNTFDDFERTFTTVEKNDSNYVIKSSEEYAGNFYEIYDNNGDLLDYGFHDCRGSFYISKQNNIVTLEYGFGGSNVQPDYRFYDVEQSKVSRYFNGPIAVKDETIAYFNIIGEKASLIVQNIFDVDKAYQEFWGKFDKFILMKITEISFSKDGTAVIIKHHETNNETNIIEETFTIRESLSDKLVREIEGAYIAEQEYPENSSNAGMVELAEKYTEKWKEAADECYNKIMKFNGVPTVYYYSSDDLHTAVSNMKVSWEQYSQVQWENYLITLQTAYGPGTIVGPIMANYGYEMQKEWALQLAGICEQLYIE